ncbi:CsbD family protein [Dactylosporangium salmoneum]
MSFQDKVQHKAEEAKGAAKDKAGDLTDDERLQAEGQAEQRSANVKQAGDKVKDAAGKAKDALS